MDQGFITSPCLLSLLLYFLSLRPLSHCFHASGKAKTLRLQPSRNSVSCSFSLSKQEKTSSSSPASKPENNAPTKTTALHPTPPPATPVAPVVRTRRARQEVLKPVVLVLPPVHFPNFFPPQHSRAGFNPNLNFNKWKPPAQTGPVSRSSGNLSKETMVKSRPLF